VRKLTEYKTARKERRPPVRRRTKKSVKKHVSILPFTAPHCSTGNLLRLYESIHNSNRHGNAIVGKKQKNQHSRTTAVWTVATILSVAIVSEK